MPTMPALCTPILTACLLLAPAALRAQAPAAGGGADAASAAARSAPARQQAPAAGGGADAAGPWSNATELSVVRTGGNAQTRTFGFRNTLRRDGEAVRLRARVEGVRSRTAGARILRVAPGLRFRPGERPQQFETAVDRRAGAAGVEQYFVEGRVERQAGGRLFWHAGASWDRNDEAGIRNRRVAFGGLGTNWADSDAFSLSTSYGVSLTDREAAGPGPGRGQRFGGLRADGDYRQRFGDAVDVQSEAALNVSLLAPSDYSLNMTSAVGVVMTDHLSLRVSLQHLYEHEPAFEDAAIVARVALVDPDGAPGSGDERFETLAAGGAPIHFGTGQIRKRRLDAVFRTALVIRF